MHTCSKLLEKTYLAVQQGDLCVHFDILWYNFTILIDTIHSTYRSVYISSVKSMYELVNKFNNNSLEDTYMLKTCVVVLQPDLCMC